MGCNCKKNNLSDENLVKKDEKITFNSTTILIYTLKIVGFIIMLLLLPLINLYIIWLMFETIILNKNVTLLPLLTFIGNKFKEKEDEDDEIFSPNEINELTESDVILLQSEEITK